MLFGALFLLLLARSRGDQWVGDFWIYTATIGELALHPFHPRNALFATDAPFAFVSPYTIGLGLVTRLTGLHAVDVLVGQGLLNLLLLGGALYAFVAAWVKRTSPAVYTLLFVLLLWGPEPWRYSAFFHLRSLAYVLPYPSTFTSALALGTLAALPRLVRSPRWCVPVVLGVGTVVWITHPVTGMFLWVGLFAFALSAPRSRAFWVAFALTAAASFALAMAWPLVPMRELWFGQIERVHEGNDLMYVDPLPRIAPALLGVPWLLWRARRDRRDPLVLFAAGLALLVVWGGLSRQWSYGRLISHLVLLLQVALADALASLEDRLARRRRGSVASHLLAPAVAVLLVALSWPVVRDVLDECVPGDRHWLSFLESRVGRYDVVLTDADTCWYVPAFHGKVVAYPMKLPFIPDHDKRLAAVGRFFDREATVSEQRDILARYDVRYVLLPKHHFEDWPDRLEVVQRFGVTVHSTAEYELVRVVPDADRAAASPPAR